MTTAAWNSTNRLIAVFNSLILLADGKILAIGNVYDPFGSDGGTARGVLSSRWLARPAFCDGGYQVLNDDENLNSGIELPDGDILVAGGVNNLVNVEPVMEAILTSVPASSPAPGQEPGQLAFAASTATVTAGDTATDHCRSHGRKRRDRFCPYTTQDDTAAAGTDYTTTSGTLTFGPASRARRSPSRRSRSGCLRKSLIGRGAR